MRMTLWLEELLDDLKFACRQLRHSPAFTLVATLTLALGIGANSATFALADATLLRPLPYGELMGSDRGQTPFHPRLSARGMLCRLARPNWTLHNTYGQRLTAITRLRPRG